ncbi:MAG: arginine--tRNA ligase [Pseudomonadota bacterium]|nr:arginine--tRNA ligase [Pseudomonadota bacterium]
MDPFKYFHSATAGAIAALQEEGRIPREIDASRIVVEPSRNPLHGHIASNAAMVIASQAGGKPREYASLLIDKLRRDAAFAHLEVAGPGFINVSMQTEVLHDVVRGALQMGAAFGQSAIGSGRTVNVEFVSANPTGPLHVGHCRGAVVGDALAGLLEAAGYKVTREYYVNDAGAQVDTFARSAYLRYREALGEDVGAFPEGYYPGDYLRPVGKALAESHGEKLLAIEESEWLPIVREQAMAMMMEMIRADLAALHVRHDVIFSERSLHASGAVRDTMAALQTKGLVYLGRLPPPKGQLPEDWEDREQTLFRATAFGDDIDRPLLKSDGSYAYFASDVAYADSKVARGFDDLIYVLGADHAGYVKRLKAVARALAGDRVRVFVSICQLVRLFRGGEPVRMSKRAGDFVTLRDVLDEVSADVVRFMMLYRKNDAPLDFDFAKVTEQSKDNPVFYVQYAHARIASVFRNAAEELRSPNLSDAELAAADLSALVDPAELSLIRRLAEFPRLIEAAAEAHEPHRISFYLYDLASEFHSLWNKGKESPQLRFIVITDLRVTMARLALLRVIRYVLANGLHILGVRPAEEM